MSSSSRFLARFFSSSSTSTQTLTLTPPPQFNLSTITDLANLRQWPKLRSHLHSLLSNPQTLPLSVPSFFHSLSSSFLPRSSQSIVADILILSLLSASDTAAAVDAFFRSGHYRYKLSTFSLNPLLSSLIKTHHLNLAQSVFNQMLTSRKIAPNSITFNTMINGLCKSGKLTKAEDMIKDMKAWGVSPNVVTYNTLIDGYCKRGKMYRADGLVKEMVGFGILPNSVTFNVLIDGYCKDGNLKGGLKFFEEMKRQGVEPSVNLGEKRKMDEANGLLNEMLEKGLVPNNVTYDIIKDGMVEKGFVPDIDGHLSNSAS
ncbi:pentatricopeptide repeat-containing protein At1g09820-like [Asparagus officinalis]|uniref:pentatricopeptide repeat-containing protein At1g09820-like n=1 Tax=Asparagus officinalis TaxID=4686 RepID=UPI00098E0561|nr:pentatricopeptide repeat-containing protein At1g09820-like [Asparagus officinalis]